MRHRQVQRAFGQRLAKAGRLARTATWVVVACLWALAVGTRSAGAAGLSRAQDTPVVMTRSTLSGVYSGAQAQSGEDLYGSTCLGGCHSLSSHRGIAFRHRWEGHSVFELYQLINDQMPNDDPGSLSSEQSLQLVAYLLKANGMPAGTEALSSDATALKKIKIEMPPSGVPSPHH
jgi:hypothetical protein